MHGWSGLLGWSLVRGPLHVALLAGAVAGLAGLLLLRRGRAWWLRRVPLAVLLAAVLLLGAQIWLAVARPWPDPLPLSVYAWVAAGLLAVALLAVGWRRRSWAPAVGVLAVLLVVLGAADGIDAVFGAYPTVATALQVAPRDQVPASSVLGPTRTDPVQLPAHGAVTQVVIPATRSGFPARPAWLYLPPAYLVSHHPLLPVLVMINGQPGGPRDWLDGGQLAQRMDAFAAAHHGLAPVVVMPDGTGGQLANPLCTDSALGRADTYLSQDVVSWVSAHLQVTPDHARWAVGGLSYGGTCALQLAVAHPGLFPTFIDASGQEAPTLGGRVRTVAVAFDGDAAAYAAIDPLQELAHRSYAGSAGFLAVGAQDSSYLPQQRVVAAAARKAGMAITTEEIPGRHDWRVWGQALQDALPWLAVRQGLIP